MNYESFEQEFEELTGIRLRLYKEKQMKRRIGTLIERKKLAGYRALMDRLRKDPGELEAFLDYITINVTEFFRTPDQWAFMEDEALTDLLERKDRIKIWCAACSTGEEPYSLAMSLALRTDPGRFHIIATDIDEKVLNSAREGIYSKSSIAKLPEELAGRFFTPCDGGMGISDEIKSRVEFTRLDLLKEVYPGDCDLIVCRNVLIYFTEEAKDQIFLKFKESLSPGGWLFTGKTEQLIYYKKYQLRKVKGFLYQNK